MTVFNFITDYYSYYLTASLMAIGLYIVIAYGNLVKKLIGLSLFQYSVFALYILMAKVEGGTAPILNQTATVYANPLPHVLILTAIVVSISVTALGLALAVRINDIWGTLEEEDFKS